MPGVQGDMGPAKHQAEVAPIIVSTTRFGHDVMEFGFCQILERQSGDGTLVVLPFQKIQLASTGIRQGSAKERSSPPFFPIRGQPGIKGTVRPLNLLKAESGETRVSQEGHQFALRSVRRRHREFLVVDSGEAVIGLSGRDLSAPATGPFAERPQCPVGEPTEGPGTVVGAVVIAEDPELPS